MSESLKQNIKKCINLLEDVVNKEGAYSRDILTHAENVIDNASSRAKKVTEILMDVLAVLDGDDNGRNLKEIGRGVRKKK